MTAKAETPRDQFGAALKAKWVGRRYDRLTVTRAWRHRPHTYAECICDCGNAWVGRAYNLSRGSTHSCGCFLADSSRERAKIIHTTHGQSETRLYQIWLGMRQRCLNPKGEAYKWYGARGIKIAPEWFDFERFMADMGQPPSAAHSLDRIDNDGNYEPGNCKWSTDAEQMRNTRRNVRITIGSETLCVSDWARRANIRPATMHARVKCGWTGEKLLKPARVITTKLGD